MWYKDTIQNFQFCSVWAWTYSLNFCLMWSKRCRVMGTPVAGSWSWHALQGEMDGKKGSKNDFKTLPSINECCFTDLIQLLIKQRLMLTWWQSSGAVSPLWVSASPRAAELSPAASCLCTQLSSATWWLYWSVPADGGRGGEREIATCQWPSAVGYTLDVEPHLHFAAVQPPQRLLRLLCCTSARSTLMLGWELSVATRLCNVSNPSLMLKRRFCSAEMWVILLVSVGCRWLKKQ